jgi:hypothetical protein
MSDARATTPPRRSRACGFAFSFGSVRLDRGGSRGHAWPAITTLLPIAGCGVAPSINILGSFFPAWLFCIVVGIVLTIATLRVLGALEIADLGPPALVYPCLAGLWAFAAWLVVFGS